MISMTLIWNYNSLFIVYYYMCEIDCGRHIGCVS